jgi:choline-sulfatase
MIRKGQFKYVYIHRHESQLFDLVADPGEWNDLSCRTEYEEIKKELKTRIHELFDPDTIDKATMESIQKRTLVRQAMDIGHTRWDVEPRFDPVKDITDQYLPGT